MKIEIIISVTILSVIFLCIFSCLKYNVFQQKKGKIMEEAKYRVVTEFPNGKKIFGEPMCYKSAKAWARESNKSGGFDWSSYEEEVEK